MSVSTGSSLQPIVENASTIIPTNISPTSLSEPIATNTSLPTFSPPTDTTLQPTNMPLLPTATLIPPINTSIPATQALLQPTPLPISPTQSFTVMANLPWQNTGIRVQANDFLQIDYSSGKWTAESSSGVYHGPDGGKNPNIFDCMPIPGEGPSLLGRISEGEPFKVGLQYLGRVSNTGPLYLRINDCDGDFLTDNDGSITVNILVNP